MKITKIIIESYRSIKEVGFNIQAREDNSFTYGLIGINEAGKSSILKAIGLKDGLTDISGIKLPLPKDFRSKEPIIITYCYSITQQDDKELYDVINREDSASEPEQVNDPENSIIEMESIEAEKAPIIKQDNEKLSEDLIIKYKISFASASTEPNYTVTVFNGKGEIEINHKEEFEGLVSKNVHKSIFWTAEDRYLISKPINIEQFSNDASVSVPLRNCFLLSSIQENEISQKLSEALEDTTECEFLEETLGKNVTEHIKSAWPNHPITITFKIMDGHINFHVRDIGTKGKAQTSDMRSDGFKQFVSFLLTIAAENKNEELQNTILLLDEPETHLHPKAQEYLLTQLIEITSNNKNNIALFATHSNYMIDKEDLGRYYRVEKKNDKKGEEQTQTIQFDNKQTSYAEVSYEVFDILDEQYHNELYDKLRDWFITYKNSNEKDESKHIESLGINAFDQQYFKELKKLGKECKDTSKPKKGEAKVTLPTFIRNCIHYPANKEVDFDDKLKQSIKLLKEFIEKDIDNNE